MGNVNRADRIEQLFKSLRKHYKPTTIAMDRPVLDLMLYACCLEDAKFENADEAFAKLQQSYYDWNEVRVTTVAELSEVLASLSTANAAATRIKRTLQALFESRYSFDVEELRKANLGKTLAELESWSGMSKFVCAFVVQNALGGHAIPVDGASIMILQMAEIVSNADADKGIVPGLDRAIPKAKGSEFATLLHQFAADFKASNKSTSALAVFKELNINPKNKPAPPPPPVDPKKVAAQAAAAAAKAVATAKGAKGHSNTTGKGKPLSIKEKVEETAKAEKESHVGKVAPSVKVVPTKGMPELKKSSEAKSAEVKPVDSKGTSKAIDGKKPVDAKKESDHKKVPEVKKPLAKPEKKLIPKLPVKKSLPIKGLNKASGANKLGKVTGAKPSANKPTPKKPTGNTKKPLTSSKLPPSKLPPSKAPAAKPKPVDPKKSNLKKIVKRKPK